MVSRILCTQKKVVKKNIFTYFVRRMKKKHYALINDFNRFIYDHSLHCARKYFVVIFTCFYHRRNIKASNERLL